MGRGEARAVLLEDLPEDPAAMAAAPVQQPRQDPTRWSRCKELCWNAFRGAVGFGVSATAVGRRRGAGLHWLAITARMLGSWLRSA